jgi:hemerythrin-like domain-containing protein
MCEYCGCQALRSIEELTREHDVVLDHVRTATAAAEAGEADTAVRTCTALRSLLQPHTAVEELALFPAMAREHPAHVASLVREHAEVDAVLDEMASDTPLVAGWEGRLLQALGTLRAHVFKEQDGLFPAALSILTPAEWDAVDAVRVRVGSPLGPAVPA